MTTKKHPEQGPARAGYTVTLESQGGREVTVDNVLDRDFLLEADAFPVSTEKLVREQPESTRRRGWLRLG